MKRFAVIAGMLVLMAGFGLGVNRWFAAHTTDLASIKAGDPVQQQARLNLPGTIYVSQNGKLYALSGSHFSQLNLPSTDPQKDQVRWTQPSVLNDGSLLAVMKGAEYSELFNVSSDGQVLQQMTKNYVGNDPTSIRYDHWIAWPHLSPDGQTLFYSYDSPKQVGSYEVDYSIWSTPLNGMPVATANKYAEAATVRGQRWTAPTYYTGGDTNPIPLRSGALIYVTYSIDSDGKVHSTVVYQASPSAKVIELTTADQDCNAATLSADELSLAMICSQGGQTVKLEVAHLSGTTLSAPSVLVDNCLCASPVWAPDGSGLIYLAPADSVGQFQLWWLDGAAGQSPKPTAQVTSGLDLDATSPPAWAAAVSPSKSLG